LNAQEDRFSIGPRGGINFANVTNVDESESITGVVLGLTTTYSLAEHSGLTLDILYSVEGYQAPFEEYKLRYLQVPLYFDFFLGELGDRLRPKAYVGIAPGFFLGGTLGGLDVNERFFKKFLIAGSGGVGFNYRLVDRVWLNTDVRAFIGLSDIRHKDFDAGDPILPRNVQLSLGVAYGLAKLK
jgi:hypothetical protein